jgi:hypothetical protein
MTPPIAIIIRITAPIHTTAPQRALQIAADGAAEAVSVVLARRPRVGRAVAGTQFADLGVGRKARCAALCAPVAVVVLFAGAAGVGPCGEGERGCGCEGGEGEDGEETHGGWLGSG